MIIDKPGVYRWLQDVGLRGPRSIETRIAGTEFVVTQIDAAGRKICGPSLPDWQRWEQPCELVREL